MRLQIYEGSISGSTKFKSTGEKLVSTITVEGALSEILAKELGNGELYRKNGTLTEFTSHGFATELVAADVTFYGMPGTPGENDALLHLPSCSVKGFEATKLDGSGATVTFSITSDTLAKAIVGFLDDVRGWNGRLDIEELQQDLPLEEGTAPTDLPKPPKKRGRGAQPKPADEEEQSTAAVEDLAAGAADVKPTKSGKARLVPRKPKSGEKKGSGRRGMIKSKK